MHRTTSQLIAVAAAIAACAIGERALAETAADQICANDDDVRLIEIRFADDEGSLPCKVIYRPADESDTLGTVSWRNISDLSVCLAKADEVIARLVSEGWTCDASQRAADNEGVATAALVAESSLVQATPEEDVAEPGTSEGAPLPAADLPSDDGAQSPATEEADQRARVVENSDLPVPPDDLAARISEDLNRLDTTLDGELEATIAGYGDLNADDIGDALVLYTYSSPQPAYRQFLAAYVSDGETFQLTATKPVSSHVSATREARVEAIDQGVIHVALQAFEPGDASCCPSGTRRLALTLRELDLVEIDADAPTR